MKLLNGVEIDGKDYDCSLVFSNNTVVSFMYIPAFIEYDEIVDKLNEKGIRVVSPVYKLYCWKKPKNNHNPYRRFQLHSIISSYFLLNPV
jgi:hypothetical protein